MNGHPATDTAERVFSFDFAPNTESLSASSPSESTERFEKAWTGVERVISNVLENQSNRVLSQVAHFLTTARIPESHLFASFSTYAPIPTAVVLGASPSSLGYVTSAWPADRQSPVFARLNARDAPSIKLALRALVTRLIASGQHSSQDPDVGSSTLVKGKRPSMLSDDNFELFTVWYRTQFGQAATADRPQILIVLEDFEAFEPIVLEDLIHILSRSCTSLPITLLLGVQTSVDAVNVLPYVLKPLLRVQTFVMQAGEETIAELFQAVLLSNIPPLSVTGSVLLALFDQFNDTDGSVLTVVAKLRYIYLLHYTSSPLTNVHDRDEDVLFHLRTLPSFRRLVRLMVEGQVKPTKQFATALREENSDDALAVLLQQATEDRDRFELQRQVALAAYTPLQRLFKDSRGQKSLDGSDLLVSLFSGELRSHAEELVQIFRRAEPTTLTSSFTLILAVLDRFTGEEVTESLLEKLQNLEQQYQGLQASFEQARRRGETSKQNLQNLELLSILGSSQRGGHIDALVKQATDLDRGFTAIVQQVADILADLFRQGFKKPTELLFHELWYYNDAERLQNAFHPSMLESVESCLQLRDADSADVLPHALASNDLSAAHRLFQDAGKLVNLADWYGSYSVALPLEADVAEASAARKSKKRTKGGAPKRKKPAEDELQAKEEQEIQRKARFVRSVSELAWLGLIFPTKRKAEHVGKLVF